MFDELMPHCAMPPWPVPVWVRAAMMSTKSPSMVTEGAASAARADVRIERVPASAVGDGSGVAAESGLGSTCAVVGTSGVALGSGSGESDAGVGVSLGSGLGAGLGSGVAVMSGRSVGFGVGVAWCALVASLVGDVA